MHIYAIGKHRENEKKIKFDSSSISYSFVKLTVREYLVHNGESLHTIAYFFCTSSTWWRTSG